MTNRFILDLSNGNSHEYQIKLSKRAKHIRINLSINGDLTVTVPHRVAVSKAHRFINSKLPWIEKHLSKNSTKLVARVPKKLDLELLKESWIIEMKSTDSIDLQLRVRENNKLIITGKIEDIESVKKLINQWCRIKCRNVFTEMMESLAQEHGFHFKRLSFRSQKTLWGSCSGNKNISLNSKLLFMPERIVKYVMIHELCHTVEMNHSSRFWTLVEECDPDFRIHRVQLKKFAKSVPI